MPWSKEEELFLWTIQERPGTMALAASTKRVTPPFKTKKKKKRSGNALMWALKLGLSMMSNTDHGSKKILFGGQANNKKTPAFHLG